MENSTEDAVFKNLNADDIDHTVTEIESCCMNCYKNVSFLIGISTVYNCNFVNQM